MIELNKEWALSADRFNITLLRRGKPRKKGGVGAWIAEGYYSNLNSALLGLVRQEVRDTHLASIQTLSDRIDTLNAFIHSMPNITVANLKTPRKPKGLPSPPQNNAVV